MKKLFFFALFIFSWISFWASNCSIYGDLAYEKMWGWCGCLFWFIPQDLNVCVMGSTYCSQKFGTNAIYSSSKEQCSCQNWYEFSTDSSGQTKCLSCSQIYWPDSEYFYLTQNCWCKEGYTLKEGKCSIRNNSAYFTLLEYDTINDQAVIQSQYNSERYLIELDYVLGITNSINGVVWSSVVLNTGIDFSVDEGDYLIIPESKETFKIEKSKRVPNSFSLVDDNTNKSIEDISKESVSSELLAYWNQTADKIADKNIIKKQDNIMAYNSNSFVLRQEIIGIAVKLRWISLPDNYSCKNIYKDVSSKRPNNWVCRVAEIGAQNGLVSKENLNFNPEKNVTRAEALAILFNAFNVDYKNFDISWYSFHKNIQSWQKPILAYAVYVDINSDTLWVLANLPALRWEIFTYIDKLMKLNESGLFDPNFISNFLGQ